MMRGMELLYSLVALAVCVSVHEASHAWVAWKLGDPTAKMAGRVSLNPLRHLDPLGTIMIFLAHFGWGKPVPFNEYNLKHPRRDSAMISIAGPLSNLLTAFVIAAALQYLPGVPILQEGLRAIFSLSIVLFLFNLLPIAPLDGSKLFGLLIPRSREDLYRRFLDQGPLLLIFLIIFDRLLSDVIGFSFFGAYLQFGYELITFAFFLIT